MDDRLLVDGLRQHDPGVLGAVYDGYAGRLYAYCWLRLRSRDAAQVALRDTLIVTEAHIDKLRDPRRFGAWLFAIARAECGRRLPRTPQGPDIPVATHDQGDVDERLLAWRALSAVPDADREMLDLRFRQDLAEPDVAAVLGVPERDVAVRVERATAALEAALTGELLVRAGPYGCATRAELLQERRGDITAGLGARLLRHARVCADCRDAAPVAAASPAKVLALVPRPRPPAALRTRVLSCFTDPDLVSYRRFVATRCTDWTPAGFPAEASADAGRAPRRGGEEGGGPKGPAGWARRRPGLLLALLGVGLVVALVAWLLTGFSGGERKDGRISAATSAPPNESVPDPPAPGPIGSGPARAIPRPTPGRPAPAGPGARPEAPGARPPVARPAAPAPAPSRLRESGPARPPVSTPPVSQPPPATTPDPAPTPSVTPTAPAAGA